jgi:hypothetical protein
VYIDGCQDRGVFFLYAFRQAAFLVESERSSTNTMGVIPLKKLIVSIAIVLLAVSLTAAQTVPDKPMRGSGPRKITLDPTTPNSPLGSDTFSDNLTGQPTFDKYYPDTDPDNTCATATTLWDEGLTEYIAIPIEVTATANLAVSITSTDISDTWFGFYCDFDPANPDLGMIASDDDDGGGLTSAFLDTDGITLQSGQVYWLVVSTYGSGDLGGGMFSLNLSTTGATFTPVELQSFSVD